jgi:hypothetical protein
MPDSALIAGAFGLTNVSLVTKRVAMVPAAMFCLGLVSEAIRPPPSPRP